MSVVFSLRSEANPTMTGMAGARSVLAGGLSVVADGLNVIAGGTECSVVAGAEWCGRGSESRCKRTECCGRGSECNVVAGD